MSISKRTVVIASVVGCATFLIGGTIIVLGVVLLFVVGGAGNNGASVRGSYPAPTSRYQGLTVAEWNSLLMDADWTVCSRGAVGLHGLGDEGTPFLLTGLIHFRRTGQRLHQGVCLQWLPSCRIDVVDLAIIVPILDDPDIKQRRTAVQLISAWGPKAKAYLPALAAHINDPDERFHNELLGALHHIDPVAYPETPPKLGPEQRPTSGFPGKLPSRKK